MVLFKELFLALFAVVLMGSVADVQCSSRKSEINEDGENLLILKRVRTFWIPSPSLFHSNDSFFSPDYCFIVDCRFC